MEFGKQCTHFYPKKLDDEKFLKMIGNISVDFIVVVAYGNLVNEEIINHPSI